MPRYTTQIPLQPSQPTPLQKGFRAYILNNHPVLYTALHTFSIAHTHPSLSAHSVSAIRPWPLLDGISLPQRKANETPLDRLYIMYYYLVRGDYNILRNEVQDFFDHAAWRVHRIPDPADHDAERYAILATIAQYLAHGINRRIRIEGLSRCGRPGEWEVAARAYFCGTRHLVYMERLERAPKWVKKVLPVRSGLVLGKGSWHFAGGRKSRRFGEKGISGEEVVERSILVCLVQRCLYWDVCSFYCSNLRDCLTYVHFAYDIQEQSGLQKMTISTRPHHLFLVRPLYCFSSCLNQ